MYGDLGENKNNGYQWELLKIIDILRYSGWVEVILEKHKQ